MGMPDAGAQGTILLAPFGPSRGVAELSDRDTPTAHSLAALTSERRLLGCALWTTPATDRSGTACSSVMAICVDCGREMTAAASCTVRTLHIGDLPFPMARHRRSGDGRCGDCGVEPGGYHHLGCDLAGCPRCGRQLISCGCPFDELDDDLDLGVDDDSADAGGRDGVVLAWRQVCPRCGSGSVIPILYGV